MIRLRHILHPFHSVRSLYRKARTYVCNRIAERQFQKIRRGERDQCWCGGKLLPFKWHPSYGICAECRCYVNRRPPVQDDLEELYSLDIYWKKRQKLKGHPSIENRAALYKSDGRLNKWLSLIEQYGPPNGCVIEVGCAPGVLLEELSKRGFKCIGVEISNDVANWMCQTMGLDVRSGFFPGVDLPACHLFLAFDVLEHSPDPEDFLREAARCLLPEGLAIIQTAIDRYDYEPPFGKRFRIFDDIEHLFLFTDKAMEALAQKAGLEIVSLKERLWLAGEICVFRKPQS